MPDVTGDVLRLARQSAGLSLGALGQRIYFSKAYLCNVERGKRHATPAVIRGYLEALGDDVNRRQLLMTLLAAGTVSAPVEALGRTFESALDEPPATVDDWLAKLDAYGRDYLLVGIETMQAQLAADLSRLQPRLDHPVLGAVAAKLLTLYGVTTVDGQRKDALRWYQLGARAGDRSQDTATRVWVQGRAAHALAYVGSDLAVARGFAEQALALSERPSTGRLHGLLALAHARALTGDRDAALAALDDAKRTFDVVGSDDDVISDFAVPEWRMATFASMLLSRLGVENLAMEAQETADRVRPAILQRSATHLELHRALTMVKSGDREEGVAYARHALGGLPFEQHGALRLLMTEIEFG